MSIARNTFYNLAGAMVPTVTALVTVPLYLQRIGEARYGVLTIVWLLLGYFGLFDLGLSRATANKIARLPAALASDREAVFWSACTLNVGFGLLGGLVLYFLGGPLLGHWFKMSVGLHAEALAALPWIAAAVPIVTLTSVLTGALEGQEYFRIVNVIQVSGVILFWGFPLLAAFAIGPSLAVIIPVAIAVRIVSVIPLALAVKATLPVRHRPRIHVDQMRQLLGYGAWVACTGVAATLLESAHRFLIGVLIGAASVSYYVVPANIATQIRIVPSALSRSLFPQFSLKNNGDISLLNRSIVILAVIVTPLIIMSMLLMQPLLNLWVGKSFTKHAGFIGEIVLTGVWINSLAWIPYGFIEGQGRPDLVAKLHFVTLPIYLLSLWFGISRWGIYGCAVAWSARVWFDSNVLFLIANCFTAIWKSVLLGAISMLMSLASIVFGFPNSATGLWLAICSISLCALWLTTQRAVLFLLFLSVRAHLFVRLK